MHALLINCARPVFRRCHGDAAAGPISPLYDSLKSLYEEILTLSELSGLAQYLLDTGIRDALSDVLMQCARELLRIECPFPPYYRSKFFRRTPNGSPTRRLVVDLAT